MSEIQKCPKGRKGVGSTLIGTLSKIFSIFYFDASPERSAHQDDHFCQAQPKPQLQLSWAEIALMSSNTPTPPNRTSSKVERLRDFYDLNSDCNKVGITSF